MKVLHVAETIKGGVATVINELVNFQSSIENIEVYCLIPEEQKEELDNKNKKTIVKKFRRERRSVRSLINLAGEFKKLISSESFDVIHLHSTFAGFICRGILLLSPYKGRVIYCPHAFSFLISGSKIKKLAYATIERILQKHTDKIVCVSDYEYDQALKNGMSKDNLTVIHNGISDDLSLFIPKEEPENITFLFVGRFDYQKGFDILINAIKKIPASLNYKFVIVGDYVNDSSKMPDSLNANIIFTGWLKREEIIIKYRECDVLLMPSRWEGFAMVPIEAFKYGMPVIASDNTSFPEIIKNGWNGSLIETGNHESLLEAILNIKKDDIKRLSINSRKTYVDGFTSDKMNQKVMDIYKGLI